MPADLSAVNAVAGARNTYCFFAGVPLVVIAVSRLTMARSAWLRTVAIGPTAVAGSAARRLASSPMKCTSPPNASVTSCTTAGDGPGAALAEGLAALADAPGACDDGPAVGGTALRCAGVGRAAVGCTGALGAAVAGAAFEVTGAAEVVGLAATGAAALPLQAAAADTAARATSNARERVGVTRPP